METYTIKLKHAAAPYSTHLAADIFSLVPRLASPQLNGRGAKEIFDPTRYRRPFDWHHLQVPRRCSPHTQAVPAERAQVWGRNTDVLSLAPTHSHISRRFCSGTPLLLHCKAIHRGWQTFLLQIPEDQISSNLNRKMHRESIWYSQ